ncbi:hypothetical protein [Bradyrhizobium diazoefficiens]|uniref:hypothetical protein n=1 Tax=Bradyrhizobium diazoefficiens TaxID=1355477 RepID=UPI00346A92D9
MRSATNSVHFMPAPGESASGFLIHLSRSFSAELAPLLSALLSDPQAVASAVYSPMLAGPISDLVGASVRELLPIFAAPHSKANYLRIGEFVLRYGQINQSTRRVAPETFADDIGAGRRPYHRLSWSIAALRIDPDTSHRLIDTCDRCGRRLRWMNTFDVSQCGDCTRRLWLCKGDSAAPDAYDVFVGELFNSTINVRKAARNQLPRRIRAWIEGDILDLIEVIGAVICLANQGVELPPNRSEGIEIVLAGDSAIRRCLRRPLDQAMCSKDRLAPALASSKVFARLRRAPSRLVSEYLMSLVI